MKLTQDPRPFFCPRNYSPIRIVRLRFHPADARLVAQVSDKRLLAWDLDGKPAATKESREPAVLPVPCCGQAEGWVGCHDFHPSGKWLATGGTDRRLRRWDWEGGKAAEKPALDMAGHEGWVEACAFSPDGKLLATAGSDNRVKLWDAATLKESAAWKAHKGPIRDLCWSPDGKKLVTGGEDGLVIVHDPAAGKPLASVEFGNANPSQGQDPAQSGAFRVAVSEDGRWLAVGGQRLLTLYDMVALKPIGTDPSGTDVAFLPGGPLLLSGFDQTKLVRIDPAKAKPSDPKPGKGGKGGPATLPGEVLATVKRNNGYGVSVRPGGAMVAMATGESTAHVWKVTR